jgi:DNA-binding CsgD family transcriptional regulator
MAPPRRRENGGSTARLDARATPARNGLAGGSIRVDVCTQLVEALHGGEFMERFWAACDDLAQFDNSCAYLLTVGAPPVRLANRHESPGRSRWHRFLEKKAYLLSPYYGLLKQQDVDGFHLMRDVAPDDFFSSEYFRIFYLPAGCRDEAVFVTRCDGDRLIVLTLERLTNPEHFSAEDVHALRGVAPLFTALLRKHWQPRIEQHGAPSLAGLSMHEDLHRTLHQFGTHILTDREREVAALILRGHSSKSAARVLEISVETERVHRKRLYAKLGISSQAALFSLFVDASAHTRLDGAHDPLEEHLRGRSKAR